MKVFLSTSCNVVRQTIVTNFQSQNAWTSFNLFFKVELMRNKQAVGRGKLMPEMDRAHGRLLTTGWVVVQITSING